MKRLATILISSDKGDLLMRRKNGDEITGFETLVGDGEVVIRAAVRGVDEEAGLQVRSEDLEFLDTYYTTVALQGEDAEIHVFVLAGVDEDRLNIYGNEYELFKIHRNDDFSTLKISALTRKCVIDYFKRHKKW